MYWEKMFDRKRSWVAMPILIWICSFGCANGQSQNAIGALRSFPRTSFSCTGRPAGYYADIEIGCQVYHMCDGLGRQFSYSCPNTTLFQQRMLICDHWYMVNCSKAEMDYTANLLIGQRDKPFVPEEENHLRTPRPDLLDRPYAPDYSGESFRNQYKQFPPIQNLITNRDERKVVDKFSLPSHHPLPTPTRWKIPQPTRDILPPASSVPLSPTKRPQSQVIATPASPFLEIQSTTRRYTTQANLVSRRFDTSEENSDLGTAHSTRYNTTSDNSAEDRHAKPSTKLPAIKIPSRVYEPPFFYPIYNKDDTPSTEIPLQASTASPFTVTKTTTTMPRTITVTPPTRPTTVSGRPFTSSSEEIIPTTPKAQEELNPIRTDPALDYSVPAKDAKAFPLPTPFAAPESQSATSSVKVPSKDLLPPLADFIIHDTATTQGPPIYYEWKIPSNGLEPPKFDPPIGVDGREEQDAPLSYSSDQINSASTTTTTIKSTNLQQQYTNNLFFSNKTQRSIDSSTSRTPTSRSIKDLPSRGTQENKISPTIPTEQDIEQLRKDLSVPDYLFPLEDIGRTGYDHSDTFNSFQLKIPQRRIDENKPTVDRWYGENPKCPECHPSFVKPGTCEPCLRR